MVRGRADVTLPEVKQIHVVCNGLAPLDLRDDA